MINTIYVHFLKYKFHLHSLRNMLEKLSEGSFFCLFLKLVQINYIFSDDVRKFYISFSYTGQIKQWLLNEIGRFDKNNFNFIVQLTVILEWHTNNLAACILYQSVLLITLAIALSKTFTEKKIYIYYPC